MLPQNALSPKQKTIKQQLSTNMVLALMPLWNICVAVALLFRPAPCPVMHCRPRSSSVQLTPPLPVPHTINPAGQDVWRLCGCTDAFPAVRPAHRERERRYFAGEGRAFSPEYAGHWRVQLGTTQGFHIWDHTASAYLVSNRALGIVRSIIYLSLYTDVCVKGRRQWGLWGVLLNFRRIQQPCRGPSLLRFWGIWQQGSGWSFVSARRKV